MILRPTLLSTTLALLVAPGAVAGTLYVDANLATGLNDGSSWADAYQGSDGLDLALAAAVANDQIFVAQGTYLPTSSGNRGIAFGLKNDVEIYGSFLGGESSPDERPPFGTAPSVLTGDLAGDDANNLFNDNSYHVVRGLSTNPSAVLDGFVVTAGNSNASGNNNRGGGIICTAGSSPTVRNCRFVLNRCTFGGGAGYINGSAPSFTDCTFEDNLGGSFGGAFDIATSGAVRFDRCVFQGNSASRAGALEIFATTGVVVTNSVFIDNTATGSSGGGGLWLGSGGTTEIRNCTVVANVATSQAAGGLRLQGSAANIANCIFWDNEGQGGAQNSANQITPGANVTYSIVEGGFAGVGNLSADPQFEDIAAGNFALTLASPAVDAGNNSMVPAGIGLDVKPSPRFVDEPSVADTGAGTAPVVDMGAFERSIGTSDLACVPTANSTGEVSVLTATGSLAITDNDVDLAAGDLPLNVFGYFLMSAGADSIPVASGTLCLGAPQYRFNTNVLNSTGAGAMAFSPDLTNLPQGQVVAVGETWYYQLWYRDGASSNFSSSLGFTWE